MKKVVIIGVDTKGVRTTKVVEAENSQIVSNPNKFGFSKVSAICSEKYFQDTITHGRNI